MSKEELVNIDTKNLKRLKKRLMKDLSVTEDQKLNESILDYISDIDNAIHENVELREEDMELVDYGDGVEYEVWEDKSGQLWRVPIERGSEEEEKEYGEVRIERFFDQAEKVSSAHAAKFGENDGSYNESEELSTDDDIIEDPINEDGDGGGSAGVAMASQGNVSGMGNVVSSQPASTPGAAFTGDGTVGSGDISMPLGVYTKKGVTGQKYIKQSKSKNKKLTTDVANFLKKHKKGKKPVYGNVPENANGKVMDYQDFVKNKSNQVTQVKK
ncbi:MAG: hypothetical protein SLAVMIC_00458 [uncultured marine phage]|uniref:Uncharacterized protein n=1 Tax=uncultured marine phage TaxID=707152 RepID=A0A8D9CD34_9VIRU|nr:MAG: hypothetical protein SLAVMIC_00458 [uncultured marine phage]